MLRHLIYPFLPYRSFFEPFLIAGAIAVSCWLIFRLYRRRSRGEKLPLSRELLLVTTVVYLAGLATATLLPNRSSRLLAAGRGGIELRPSMASLTCRSTRLPEGSTARAFCLHNARGNVMLFFPLGVLLPLLWPALRVRRALLIALALSASIDLLQYLSSAWGSYRAADVNDVILNVVGASLGLAVVSSTTITRMTRIRADTSA